LIDEEAYASRKCTEFLPVYLDLVKKYGIKVVQDDTSTFLGKWFLAPVREEIDFMVDRVKKLKDKDLRRTVAVILSRTVRSCRATTHADLATLKEPVVTTYYCKKHGKICKPIFSIEEWWSRYSFDTLERLREFDGLRTDTFQIALVGDSRTINVVQSLKEVCPNFAEFLEKQRIDGIFSSPPYVGLIDYHEQHAYAYELFGFERKDHLEIGPLFEGQGKRARDSYIKGIGEDYDVFLVANDKFGLYPDIAAAAQMRIVQTYKRPVLNRVEKDRSNAYCETIFHLKEK